MRNIIKAALVLSFLVPAVSFADAPKKDAPAAKSDAKTDAKDAKAPAKTDAKAKDTKAPAKTDAKTDAKDAKKPAAK